MLVTKIRMSSSVSLCYAFKPFWLIEQGHPLYQIQPSLGLPQLLERDAELMDKVLTGLGGLSFSVIWIC